MNWKEYGKIALIAVIAIAVALRLPVVADLLVPSQTTKK